MLRPSRPPHLHSLLRLKGCSAISSQAPDCASLLPGKPGVASWGPRIHTEALDCPAEEGADVLVDCRGPARGAQPVSKPLPAGGCVVWHAPPKCRTQGTLSRKKLLLVDITLSSLGARRLCQARSLRAWKGRNALHAIGNGGEQVHACPAGTSGSSWAAGPAASSSARGGRAAATSRRKSTRPHRRPGAMWAPPAPPRTPCRASTTAFSEPPGSA